MDLANKFTGVIKLPIFLGGSKTQQMYVFFKESPLKWFMKFGLVSSKDPWFNGFVAPSHAQNSIKCESL